MRRPRSGPAARPGNLNFGLTYTDLEWFHLYARHRWEYLIERAVGRANLELPYDRFQEIMLQRLQNRVNACCVRQVTHID